MSKKILAIVGLIILLLMGGGIYWWQTAKKDQSADWQTYRNEQYGFEIKYPKTWEELKPSDINHIIFKNSNEKSDYDYWFDIQVIERFYEGNQENKNMNIWLEKEKNNRKNEKGYEEITIAGQRAIKFIYDPTPQSPGNIVYEFVKENRGYILTILYVKQSNGIGGKIISTFRFTK